MDNFNLLALSRGILRLILALGGILCVFMGYRLYSNGSKMLESGDLNIDSGFIKILASGYGPGVVFMIMGAIILIILAFKSKTTLEESKYENGKTKSKRFVGYSRTKGKHSN